MAHSDWRALGRHSTGNMPALGSDQLTHLGHHVVVRDRGPRGFTDLLAEPAIVAIRLFLSVKLADDRIGNGEG